MSVDYTAVLMYGKQFESLKHASDFLIGEGAITKKDYDYANDYNVLPDDFELVFVIIDCYTGGVGVLGIVINPSELENVSLASHLDDVMNRTDAIIGVGCEIELFVVTS